jgi:deoxyribodipyrimidine photo-lyase
MNHSSPIVFHWFRRDLRLEDNTALFHALTSGLPVVPVFIFDIEILSQLSDKDDARITFIHDSLSKINIQLKKYNSSVLVKYGKPLEIWKELLKEFKAEAIYLNHDYEPYAVARDESIRELFIKNKKQFHSYKDHVIFEKDEITKSDGTPYHVFTPYSKVWFSLLTPEKYQVYPSEKKLNRMADFRFPELSLEEIGFIKSKIKVPAIDFSKSTLTGYEKYRNSPGDDKTSKAGAHLRFGTVSIRELVRQSLKVSQQYLTELAWREFFVQILHHHPRVVHQSFKPAYDNIKWLNNEKMFDAWCNGKTGYPMVDAGMNELNQTGFMHNRVRMVVASFLCKHLLIDWRWGEAYFAQKLLDYDLSANNGNWQWAAGTGCDAAPYFRIFNPESQMERFDKEMKYIKKWIPGFDPENYIKPIVEHKFARERALQVYKMGIDSFK